MDSSELLKEDKLASIRRRNKILIAIFFSLIIILALITGRTIISLVQKINSKSLKSNRAIAEFCSPFKFQPACIDSISSATNPSPHADPNQIFLLSLESSLTKISEIVISTTRSELALPLSNCSSSSSHAAGQLNGILEILRIDPDVESYDRRNMTAWMSAAVEDLAACAELESEDVGRKVADVAAVVAYGKDFLANCDVVNSQFRWVSDNSISRSWKEEVVENLITTLNNQYAQCFMGNITRLPLRPEVRMKQWLPKLWNWRCNR